MCQVSCFNIFVVAWVTFVSKRPQWAGTKSGLFKRQAHQIFWVGGGTILACMKWPLMERLFFRNELLLACFFTSCQFYFPVDNVRWIASCQFYFPVVDNVKWIASCQFTFPCWIMFLHCPLKSIQVSNNIRHTVLSIVCTEPGEIPRSLVFSTVLHILYFST
jgi:hypothetical protein